MWVRIIQSIEDLKRTKRQRKGDSLRLSLSDCAGAFVFLNPEISALLVLRPLNSDWNLFHWPFSSQVFLFIYFFKDFIYSFDRQRSQVGREAGRERGREASSPLSREPDAGLDPRTLRSWPELKAEALTHWATQAPQYIINFWCSVQWLISCI